MRNESYRDVINYEADIQISSSYTLLEVWKYPRYHDHGVGGPRQPNGRPFFKVLKKI